MQNRASFNVVPTGALSLNQVITLNANGDDRRAAIRSTWADESPRSGRRRYIIADTTNPAGGFTDAEYQSFATTFDTLVNPMDVQNFGAPSDIDKNGKIIILFTKEVNKITPRGSNGIVAGFFYERDLFPTVGNGDLEGCPSSNVSEMYYALVPDPNGVFSDKRSKADVLDFTTSTLAHEYQHLINAGRRLYVNNAPVFEDTWLNEGLSHIAEELLYFKAVKLAPRQNLDVNAVIAAGSMRSANSRAVTSAGSRNFSAGRPRRRFTAATTSCKPAERRGSCFATWPTTKARRTATRGSSS